MLQVWGLRISHHFSGGVYWKILLRVFSRAVTTKEILDGSRRRKRKQVKAKNLWHFEGEAEARIQESPLTLARISQRSGVLCLWAVPCISSSHPLRVAGVLIKGGYCTSLKPC